MEEYITGLGESLIASLSVPAFGCNVEFTHLGIELVLNPVQVRLVFVQSQPAICVIRAAFW